MISKKNDVNNKLADIEGSAYQTYIPIRKFTANCIIILGVLSQSK